jgi:hypothetical protein
MMPQTQHILGDNGRGAGAAHQTGWTGLIAKLIQPRAERTDTTLAKTRKSTPKPSSEAKRG